MPPKCLFNVGSSRSASKIFYAETLDTTILAISGLSLQTPSVRMIKSAGSKTWPLTKSSTARQRKFFLCAMKNRLPGPS